MNKITVWASRKVNIGSYESRDFGVSFTREQINQIEATGKIEASKSMDIPNDADFNEVAKDMFEDIDTILNEKEDSLRIESFDYVEDKETSIAKLHNKNVKPDLADTKGSGAKLRAKSLFDEDEDESMGIEKPVRKSKRPSRRNRK